MTHADQPEEAMVAGALVVLAGEMVESAGAGGKLVISACERKAVPSAPPRSGADVPDARGISHGVESC